MSLIKQKWTWTGKGKELISFKNGCILECILLDIGFALEKCPAGGVEKRRKKGMNEGEGGIFGTAQWMMCVIGVGEGRIACNLGLRGNLEL